MDNTEIWLADTRNKTDIHVCITEHFACITEHFAVRPVSIATELNREKILIPNQ